MAHWYDPTSWSSLSDVPIIGGIYDAVRGNPDAIKSAYDEQIAASKASQQQLQQFLMGQKDKTLGYYAPIQHMYQNAYGTEGMQAPQVPQSPGVGPLARTYGGK